MLIKSGLAKPSPNTESTGTTPGKTPLALPASTPVQENFPYEIEEVTEPAERVRRTVRHF